MEGGREGGREEAKRRFLQVWGEGGWMEGGSYNLVSPSVSDEEFVDLEKDFEKNELNSAVYLISMAMQISNFAVNYKVL